MILYLKLDYETVYLEIDIVIIVIVVVVFIISASPPSSSSSSSSLLLTFIVVVQLIHKVHVYTIYGFDTMKSLFYKL